MGVWRRGGRHRIEVDEALAETEEPTQWDLNFPRDGGGTKVPWWIKGQGGGRRRTTGKDDRGQDQNAVDSRDLDDAWSYRLQ